MYFFTPTRDGAARTATSTWYSVQAQCAGAGRPSLMECAGTRPLGRAIAPSRRVRSQCSLSPSHACNMLSRRLTSPRRRRTRVELIHDRGVHMIRQHPSRRARPTCTQLPVRCSSPLLCRLPHPCSSPARPHNPINSHVHTSDRRTKPPRLATKPQALSRHTWRHERLPRVDNLRCLNRR